jgi:hypothetical protein
MVGLNLTVLGQVYQYNNSGCGTIGIQQEASGTAEGNNVLMRTVVENSSTNALLVAGTGVEDTITCYWCDFAMPQTGLTSGDVVRNSGGGTLKFFGGLIKPANSLGSNNTGIAGYRCISGAGSAYFQGVNFDFSTATGATGIAVWLNGTGCKAYLTNSQIIATKTGTTAFNDGGSTSGAAFYSLGGNTVAGAISITNGATVMTSPSDNLSTATGYTLTCSSTGLTQSACVVAGTNEKGTIRVTAGGVGGAFTETLNFLGTFLGPTGTTPECTFQYANTGTAWTAPALLTTASKSSTSYVISGSGTTIAADNYDMDYVCAPR